MTSKPPKPEDTEGKDALGSLERALLEARQCVAEALYGLRAVLKQRDASKLADDTDRYVRSPKKDQTARGHSKPKRK